MIVAVACIYPYQFYTKFDGIGVFFGFTPFCQTFGSAGDLHEEITLQEVHRDVVIEDL